VLFKSTAAFELQNLKQNGRRVSEYTSKILLLARLTEHNEFSLCELYESNLDFNIHQRFALLNPYPDTVLKMSKVAARIEETNFCKRPAAKNVGIGKPSMKGQVIKKPIRRGPFTDQERAY
jgi:hypothetical protein